MNVDRLVDECYRLLPENLRQRPWSVLNHGYDVLDTDEKLNAYIASYGEMHIEKCRRAMQGFPFNEIAIREHQDRITDVKPLEIFDWGCGQGLGSLTFLQLLHERGLLHAVRRVHLIEPSRHALKRADGWVRQSIKPNTEICVYNRLIPSNGADKWTDIECKTPIAIHICSNILDVKSVGIKWLAETTQTLCANNYYICVGPLYGRGVSRISDFHNSLSSPECFLDLSLFPCGYTSRTRHPYGLEAKCFKTFGSNVNEGYVEVSTQQHIDEYDIDVQCLGNVLAESVISAYKTLRSSCAGGFDLFLRPAIGIERPDFLLANISRGMVIVNVCSKIEDFEREFNRVEAIKQAMFDTYIKSLKIGSILTPAIYNSVKTALYFPSATDAEIESAMSQAAVMSQNASKYMLMITPRNAKDALSGVHARAFRHDVYQEFLDLVIGKWHHYSDGDLSLSPRGKQKDIVEDESQHLRVRGVAGSGKTQILAHKAVREHLRTGRKVLIVTFNISLIQYIKGRISQVPADFNPDAFDIINYHQFFCSKARKYHGRHIPFGAFDDAKFFEPYKGDIIRSGDQYDTVMVDEAQDYKTAWFDTLRKYFLKPDGRFILFGDGEQNIYNREQETGTKMPRVNEFKTLWKTMGKRVCKRILNPDIARVSSLFAQQFGISSEGLDMEPTLSLFDYKTGYWLIAPNTGQNLIAQNVCWILQHHNLSAKDTVVLAQGIDVLRETEYEYRKMTQQRAINTFETKEEYDEVLSKSKLAATTALDLRAIRRVAKVHFTTDSDCIKFATIPSFKGWEAKNIILLLQNEVDDLTDGEEQGFAIQSHANVDALIYTAITRARENLFILNLGNKKYHDFFNGKL